MPTATEEKKANTDFLNMSDDELANVDPSTFAEAPVVEPVAEEVVAEEQVSQQQKEVVTPDGNEETDEGETPAQENTEELLKGGEGSTADKPGGKEESIQEAKAVEPTTPKEEAKKEPEAVDYKAVYDRLMTPFKANGRDIAVKNVDDAIALMQMGANYNKKMAALKPNLKLLKLLENNGLLDEGKISYLIDLEKKNPEAINKLVKDSGIDPLDLTAEKAGDYKPGTYAVDDREMELDQVLDELQGTPSYNQTLAIVSNKWDGASKQVIANQPQLLKVINSHVQSGIYDLISKEIESERMFGRLDGLSDIEAYRQVGDAIQARGGFNHLVPQAETPKQPEIVQPKPKTIDEEKRREKKLAAGSTKPVAASANRQDFNPLALSDDAFDKLVQNEYL